MRQSARPGLLLLRGGETLPRASRRKKKRIPYIGAFEKLRPSLAGDRRKCMEELKDWAKDHILHECRRPRYEAFEPRNVWSLFNAFTESLKDGNLAEPPKRTEALRGLLDTHVGLGLN